MLTLKTYQTQALDSLQRFLLTASSTGSLAAAWAQEQARLAPDGGQTTALPYRREPFGDTPCVCLRIPTGGGKTLLAAHAIALIARTWRQADFPVALWLVPSTTIREQTQALQQPGHACRAALEAAYGQALMVLDLDAAPTLAPQDLGRKAIVLVATMQSFRVRQTQGRNVYAFSEEFDAHFAHFKAAGADMTGLEQVGAADLEEAGQSFLTPADLGRVKHSLANLLALVRPVLIVDEAHNAKTDTTFETLKRIAPCAILELTATPVPRRTNVLYSVSARELQAEDMVKLPVMLAEHRDWTDAVRDAVLRRQQLEAEAAGEGRGPGRYLRPIVLFQAHLPGLRLIEQSDLFEIYVNNTRLELKQAQDTAQLSLDAVPSSASEDDLTQWLVKALMRQTLTETALRAWVSSLLGRLQRERGVSLTGLLRARHALVQAALRRLDDLETQTRRRGFQQLILLPAQTGADAWSTGLSPDWQFRYQAGRYPARHVYAGRWRFRKHYFDEIHALKAQGEEFECAKAIDALPQSKHWVRNIERQREFSFWLPTASDNLYPDFVAELNDGRLLVVEYKGDAYASNDDSREKRAVGQAWARASQGRALFVMVERLLDGLDVAAQLQRVVAT